jgi:chromosome segregation ATPase
MAEKGKAGVVEEAVAPTEETPEDMGARIKELEGLLELTKTDLSNARNQGTELRTQKAVLEGDLYRLKSDLAEAKDEILQLKEDLHQSQGELQGAQGAFATSLDMVLRHTLAQPSQRAGTSPISNTSGLLHVILG